MDHEQDFEHWARELEEAHIPSLPALERRRYWRRFTAAVLISVGIITTRQLFDMSTADTNDKPSIASPATYSYSYGQDHASITVPTPDNHAGGTEMTVELTCNNNGSLTAANTSSTVRKTFTASDIENMRIAGVTTENPCNGGLDVGDSENLGSIVQRNGFATYNLPSGHIPSN